MEERAVGLGPETSVRVGYGATQKGIPGRGTTGGKAQRHESGKQSVVPSSQRDGDMKRGSGTNVKWEGPNLAGP